MESTVFYDSLRALGPIEANDVPETLATQIVATGSVGKDHDQVKHIIAMYSRMAATSTREEFQSMLSSGALPADPALAAEAEMLAAASKSCCGHTCEGTCTPASTR